jgi:hypothetical protein
VPGARNLAPRHLITWLRRCIGYRKFLAENAVRLGASAVWREQSSGVLVTGEPTEDDHWHGTWAMGDSTLTRLMDANDPQDTIARCEAELAVLDEHPPIPLSETHDGCKTCVTWLDDEGQHEFGIAVSELWPCRTVRLLAGGYRHQPGYQDEWKP